MRIVAISDTHGKHESIAVPDGDVLIHAGDFTYDHNSPKEPPRFNEWLKNLPHRHKIVIAGNHDWCMARREFTFDAEITYLQDSAVVIDGVSFWGSPWTPHFFDWAFNFDERPEVYLRQATRTWLKMPNPLDVLITHGPPLGVMDRLCDRYLLNVERNVGCEHLALRVEEVRPQCHIFGHIHKYGGQSVEREGTKFCNVSVCGENYKPKYLPTVIDINPRGSDGK